ncbi:MAG: zinc ribbon domain-containing protein [Acidobacteriia bacterium]|nr:zinc ribbon domain-containing protein [Terriglobia bacterium]MBV9746551.1 zinc ribbon domain-containing protein [Terriglobia bacterium]
MAYCTNCGASIDSAYCPKCGKPTGQAVAAPPAATPPRRKTSVWVWILVVVLAVVLAGGIATVAGGLWVAHKVKEAGVDPDLFRENPGLAISKLINAADPNAEIVSTDTGAGTVTLRDRRTGKEITVTFDQVRKGNFHLEATDENGKHAVVDLGPDAANKLPAEVPVYPGAKVQATFEVDGNGEKGLGAYEYEFLTPDAPSKVLDYYHRRLEDDGMTLALNNHSADDGMIVAEDDAHRRTLRVIVSRDSDGTKINLTARVKR